MVVGVAANSAAVVGWQCGNDSCVERVPSRIFHANETGFLLGTSIADEMINQYLCS